MPPLNMLLVLSWANKASLGHHIIKKPSSLIMKPLTDFVLLTMQDPFLGPCLCGFLLSLPPYLNVSTEPGGGGRGLPVKIIWLFQIPGWISKITYGFLFFFSLVIAPTLANYTLSLTKGGLIGLPWSCVIKR